MSKITSLTAWERWEMGTFGETDDPIAIKAMSAATPRRPALVPASNSTEEDSAHLREAIRQEAYQAGFDSGRTDGRKAGREAAEIEACELATHLAQAISRFDASIDELEQAVADELLALALEIARKVTHRVVVVQPDVVLDIIREALAQLPLQHAMIHLNPEDAALVRQHAGEQLTHAGHRIQEDIHLARGDVVVEAGNSQIDARLATRWQRVVAALDRDTPWLAGDNSEHV